MFGLGLPEIFLAGFVGLLLFGGNLPKVAAEAATWVVRLKRSLTDLRRETGIDREIENAKREIENRVENNVRILEAQQKLTDTIARPFREAMKETEAKVNEPPPSPSLAPPIPQATPPATEATPPASPPAPSNPTSDAKRDEAAG